MFDGPSAVLPLVQSGDLRALAKLDGRPFPPLPDLPTLAAAAGVDLGNVTVWLGLVAPRGTPPAIVDKLSGEVANILGDPRAQGQSRCGRLVSGDQHARRIRRFHPAGSRALAGGRQSRAACILISADRMTSSRSFRLGPLLLPNRVVMAPMTRNRAGPSNAPGAMNATYYAQRASAGLIISEATQVSPQGVGYPGTPGIHSDEQIAGWKLVTDAVHAAGGRIFLQLWHVGRISHPSLQPGGALPVAPSAIAPAGQAWTREGMKPLRDAARARHRRDRRHRRGLPARRAQRQGRRFRRRRAARRQWLSGRSISARRRQQAHRPLRRQRVKPRALSSSR